MLRRRILVAGLLSMLIPGAGHVYLRAWIRATTWFTIAIATVLLVIPESASTGVEMWNVDTILQASRELPLRVHAAILIIRVMSSIDAIVLAIRGTSRSHTEHGENHCPQCGGELDDALDFCPWCTTRFDATTGVDTQRE